AEFAAGVFFFSVRRTLRQHGTSVPSKSSAYIWMLSIIIFVLPKKKYSIFTFLGRILIYKAFKPCYTDLVLQKPVNPSGIVLA
ncbi:MULTISPECIES: hypothetical protein, partial [unclassified Oscillibacter]|uniref:hypothetical protein n=1 Tax=unclassified Oscillibacter TaxID=2629304 RepID=UPI0025D817FC